MSPSDSVFSFGFKSNNLQNIEKNNILECLMVQKGIDVFDEVFIVASLLKVGFKQNRNLYPRVNYSVKNVFIKKALLIKEKCYTTYCKIIATQKC